MKKMGNALVNRIWSECKRKVCVCARVCVYMHVHRSSHSGHVQAKTKSLFLLYLQGHIQAISTVYVFLSYPILKVKVPQGSIEKSNKKELVNK